MFFEDVNSGDVIIIKSFKHDGSVHRVWDETTVLYCDEYKLIGGNHCTRVTEANGDQWRTEGSAIVYFSASHWFNVVAFSTAEGVEYYCNLASPSVLQNKELDYIDYDLDIAVKGDRTFQLLDEDEFDLHKEAMHYPAPLVSLIEAAVEELKQWIREQRELFAPQQFAQWMAQFKALKEKR
ncbi:UPF0374 protein [Pullulanibacillus camelliae]|uniref:UPF0374 protein n=1 Tax=Pullulanibacillus camelliae TaxID=1707096 RepID=A0A8J3DVS7_9BACL|nr:DUF402 domain-containing protein [Pullulanibacillus camelliae]GGE45524.1 UPF0374 protein [Pullulanibacillus camelliae]